MTLYETTFIINPQTDDATIDRHVRDVAGVITNNQGRIRYEDNMGTRRLAYEIQGLTQGYYASFIFEGPTTLLPQLERHFKLNESFLRYLTVRFEGDLSKFVPAEETEPEKPAEKPAAPAEPAAETAPAEEAPAAEEKTEEPAADTADETVKVETTPEPAETKPEGGEAEAPDEDQEL